MTGIKIYFVHIKGKIFYYLRTSLVWDAYLLWKDGTLHDTTGYQPEYWGNESRSPGYWKTKKEAEQFLKEWPEKYPEEFAAYIAKRLIG